jgi:hypothetical protein
VVGFIGMSEPVGGNELLPPWITCGLTNLLPANEKATKSMRSKVPNSELSKRFFLGIDTPCTITSPFGVIARCPSTAGCFHLSVF